MFIISLNIQMVLAEDQYIKTAIKITALLLSIDRHIPLHQK